MVYHVWFADIESSLHPEALQRPENGPGFGHFYGFNNVGEEHCRQNTPVKFILLRLCLCGPTCTSKVGASAKMALTSASVPIEVPTGSCPSGRSLKIAQWISFITNTVTSQTSAFELSPVTSDCMSEPLKRSIVGPHRSFWSPECKPHWFPKSHILRGCICLVQVPRFVVPDVGHKLLTLQGKVVDPW